MNIKSFRGLEEIYPERVEGTDSWYYGQWTLCSEAYEVPDFNNEYPGTRLYFMSYPSGEVFEPIKQERNVFLERPVYEKTEDSFGIIRYDFNQKIIQVLSYLPQNQDVRTLVEVPFSKLGNLNNVRLITSPLALVKHEIQKDAVEFLWPEERHIDLEKNESLYFQNEGKLYTSKWMEDPEYREEIIIRDAKTNIILERKPGYMRVMPDGFVWMMTR